MMGRERSHLMGRDFDLKLGVVVVGWGHQLWQVRGEMMGQKYQQTQEKKKKKAIGSFVRMPRVTAE